MQRRQLQGVQFLVMVVLMMLTASTVFFSVSDPQLSRSTRGIQRSKSSKGQ